MASVEPDPPWWSEAFAWSHRYADQSPDFGDAMPVLLAQRAGARLWTYDSELEKIWRLPNGRKVRLVPAARGAP